MIISQSIDLVGPPRRQNSLTFFTAFYIPLLQLVSEYPSYQNNQSISRSNVIVRITTTVVLFFLVFM